MPGEFSQRYVRELRPRAHTAQHQASAAHITSADELLGKQQSVSEDAEHGFQVLKCRHASQKDKVAAFARNCFQGTAGLFEWQPVTWIRDIDRNRCNVLKLFNADDDLGGDQAPCRSDHVCAGNALWWRGKRLRIGQLPAKVQPAYKSERFAQSGGSFAQPDGQIELRAGIGQ